MTRKSRRLVMLGIVGLAWVIRSAPALAQDKEITIHSIPEPAEIRINGVSKGRTPLLLMFRENTFFKIEFVCEGFSVASLDYIVKISDSIVIDLASGKPVSLNEYQAYLKGESAPANPASAPAVQNPPPAESGTNPPADVSAVPAGPQPRIVDVGASEPLPAELASQDAEGTAMYQISINNRGKVSDVKPVQPSSIPGFDGFVRKWVEKWTFEPAKDNGFPISSVMAVNIQYMLKIGKFEVKAAGETIKAVTMGAETAPKPPEKSVPESPPSRAEPPDQPTPVLEKPTDSPEGQEIAAGACHEKNSADKPPLVLQDPKFGSIPNEIQNLNLKGGATFSVLISTEGRAVKVRIVQGTGNQQLDDWITPFLLKTEWEPAQKSGSPVACWRELKMKFNTTACSFQFPDIFTP